MMNRSSFPSFIKKPAAPSSRMKSTKRHGIGGDMSEAQSRHQRSFIAKPTKPKRLK